ncbi:hypothetical protein DFH08DRAFT_823334 [Mycena albidolilacea]|uniref:Uncharacterized protein n=1 Tax=Mycena albidolilacea TaxID=1033008 RepID=A0AAD6Z7K2_9AGAR|nr:hypothetical protein DFH08DRAFT_823334 [Mycena albidolilacea]
MASALETPTVEMTSVVVPAPDAPTSEDTVERRPIVAPMRDPSPSNSSVVSLGPEEDVTMTDAGVPGPPERREAGEIPVADESTYVLIHGYSFSFGLGDLRVWLRLPSTGIDPESIAGIYRLLQSNYRVDYFFEVRNARNAELLLRAGEDHARSAGARYMSRESFERAVTGLRRDGVDASPPPERPKLPSFKKTERPRAPSMERRALGPVEDTRDSTVTTGRKSLRRYSCSPSPRPTQRTRVRSPSVTRFPERRLRSPSPPRYRGRLQSPERSFHRSPERSFRPTYNRRSPSPRYSRPFARSPSPRRVSPQRRRITSGRRTRSPSPRGRLYSPRTRRSPERTPPLARRLADPDAIGRMAARTVWDEPRRVPPTAPRAERFAITPSRAQEAVNKDVPPKSLLGRLTEPKKPLLDRLQMTRDDGNRALLDRMKVGLKERVSTVATSKRRRAHNRPLKRLERLLRMEEEIRREWEEFRWTDAEIDWIIDQEEMLPLQEDDHMDED